MQILALALILALMPTTAPMKQYIPPKPKQTVTYTTFEVTAYTRSGRGMRGDGVTASGVRAKRWHTVAASRSYPIGTRIFIPQLGRTFVVEDRGGAIHGNRLDLFVSSKAEAKKFGRKKLKGIILP